MKNIKLILFQQQTRKIKFVHKTQSNYLTLGRCKDALK